MHVSHFAPHFRISHFRLHIACAALYSAQRFVDIFVAFWFWARIKLLKTNPLPGISTDPAAVNIVSPRNPHDRGTKTACHSTQVPKISGQAEIPIDGSASSGGRMNSTMAIFLESG